MKDGPSDLSLSWPNGNDARCLSRRLIVTGTTPTKMDSVSWTGRVTVAVFVYEKGNFKTDSKKGHCHLHNHCWIERLIASFNPAPVTWRVIVGGDCCHSSHAPGHALPTDQDEVLHGPAKNERTMRLVLRCPSTRTSSGTQPRRRPSVNRKLCGKNPRLCKQARYVTDTLPWRGDHGFCCTT